MLMIRLETTKTRNTDEVAIVCTNCELQELLKCHFRLFFFCSQHVERTSERTIRVILQITMENLQTHGEKA